MQKPITTRERCAVYALAAGVVNNWTDAFIVSTQDHEDVTRRRGGLTTMVTRWKQRQDIKDLYLAAQRYFMERDDEAVKRWQREHPNNNPGNTGDLAGNQSGDGNGGNICTEAQPTAKRGTMVDYTNPVNQSKKLNELINRADNTGEALDALKVIIQTQKADRDAARDGRQVRAYVPISCNDCPLYQNAAQFAKKKVTI